MTVIAWRSPCLDPSASERCNLDHVAGYGGAAPAGAVSEWGGSISKKKRSISHTTSECTSIAGAFTAPKASSVNFIGFLFHMWVYGEHCVLQLAAATGVNIKVKKILYPGMAAAQRSEGSTFFAKK